MITIDGNTIKIESIIKPELSDKIRDLLDSNAIACAKDCRRGGGKAMKYLSLFSGAGGGDLACQHLLGWECMGYVDNDEYCCRVLEQRIADGFLSDAPVFQGDIRNWIKQGYARAYQDMVDVIAGGDPCQANSAAVTSPSQFQSLAEEFLECVRIVQPKFVFRENPIPRNDAPWPFWKFEHGLTSIGYIAKTALVRACCVGADHRRARLFTIGHCTNHYGQPILEALEDSVSGREKETRATRTCSSWIPWRDESEPLRLVPNSHLCRRTNDVPCRVDRLKCSGNGIVPKMAQAAWEALTGCQPFV